MAQNSPGSASCKENVPDCRSKQRTWEWPERDEMRLCVTSASQQVSPSNETKLSRGYLRTRLRCSENILIRNGQGNKPGSRRL